MKTKPWAKICRLDYVRLYCCLFNLLKNCLKKCIFVIFLFDAVKCVKYSKINIVGTEWPAYSHKNGRGLTLKRFCLSWFVKNTLGWDVCFLYPLELYYCFYIYNLFCLSGGKCSHSLVSPSYSSMRCRKTWLA